MKSLFDMKAPVSLFSDNEILNTVVMNKHLTDKLKFTEQFLDVLLVTDTQKKKIEATMDNGKDQERQIVTPKKKNENQFMRIDKHVDLFTNFFHEFLSSI